MRTFIAIELPKEIKNSLSCLQEELKKQNADVKWVDPSNIHLTLKFLGEIEDKKIDKLVGIMQEVAKNNPPFAIGICSLGAFPKIEFPRIIWVGVDQGDKETKKIAKDLEERLFRLDIPKEERSFSSHITIARVKSNLNRIKLTEALKKLEDNWSGKNLEFLVAKITLFKSTLTPKGPIYEALKETTLEAI